MILCRFLDKIVIMSK